MQKSPERRLYISATSQNDGKTSCCIGLMHGLREYVHAVGFIKPVGQRYVTVGDDQVDEDAVAHPTHLRLILCLERHESGRGAAIFHP